MESRPPSCVLSQVMIAFEDLAVYFTWEEWQNMNQAQKILYRDVMLETYSSLFSLGHCRTKPDLIFKLEQGADVYITGREAKAEAVQQILTGVLSQVLLLKTACPVIQTQTFYSIYGDQYL
uniref:Uncharacterized protein n=1 Tax=Oryctolagus cuniculus TaxID=9986 RepID=A0A5F9CJC6_RABIT